MNNFEQHVFHVFQGTIEGWNVSLRADIYALCIFQRTIWSQVDSDFIQPHSSFGPGEITFESVLSLGYACLSEWEAESEEERKKWLRPWHYRGGIAQVPHIPEFGQEPDFSEMQLRDRDCASANILPIGKDETGRPLYGDDFYLALQKVARNVSLRLHHEQIIEINFGKQIPVIIATEEGVSNLSETLQANPQAVLIDFKRYVKR